MQTRKNVRVVVRDEKTRKYLGLSGGWVDAPREAKEFGSLQSAGAEAVHGDEYSVVLCYQEPTCELAINPVFCV